MKNELFVIVLRGCERTTLPGNHLSLRALPTYLEKADPLILCDAARRERQCMYVAPLDVE